ncbi:MAG TPA: TRAP transporter large permease subunit [Thermodesulfobacteriota bacterium]|nr:TRAP transporter large permease subunit [Thermodesulfobacteriota bacterium]
MSTYLFGLSPQTLGVIQLFVLVPAIFLGFPTAFVLLALGFVFGYIGFGPLVYDLMVSRAFAVMTNDVLVSVPLFIFMGYVLERSGILDRLFRAIQVAMGPVRGSLALATLITCTIFATATGIIGASVTLMGLLAMPAMLRAGYDKRLAAGAVTAGGCLGILIPPSVLLILYGATAGQSVVQLYAAAFLPGLLLSGLYLVYVAVRCFLQPELGPPLPKSERDYPFWQIVLMFLTSVAPITLLIAAVLGTIVFGLAAPTEAASMGAIGALVLSAAYRRLNWATLKDAVFQTARTSSMVLFLLVGSSLFAAVFARLGGAEVVGNFLLGLGLSAEGFIWLTMFIIFLLGWPLEWTEIIVIFLPLFIPLLDRFGIDPIWYGILVALNLQTAFLSPPVAMAAFYLKGVSPPEVTLNDIYLGMAPFMALQVVGLVLVFFFPQIALWLPHALIR